MITDKTSSAAGPSRPRHARLGTADVHLDPSQLDQDIPLLISSYLRTHAPPEVARLVDEHLLGGSDGHDAERDEVERALLDGDFGSLEGLIARPGLLGAQNQKSFLYLCYRQQFLEHIENREPQKAFNLLSKRLKPLEHYQTTPHDFHALSYLTTAGGVHDAPGLGGWEGAKGGREALVRGWREMTWRSGSGGKVAKAGRLEELLRQAAAWQVDRAGRKGKAPWRVSTLLEDFCAPSVPGRLLRMVCGEEASVKCVDWVGDDLAVSSFGHTALHIFNPDTGESVRELHGHTSRVWDCAVSESGELVASASGDGTVGVWRVEDGRLAQVLGGQGGDVYGVRWRPGRQDQLVSASYDKIVRSWDVETRKEIRTFSGHGQSTLAVAFDPTGNIIASGSKDKQIRLWDAVGGVCVQTLQASLGEITSVEFEREGRYLLAGCKDNSNRLWDLRMQRNLYRYTGHQNTSKNLIRACFAGGSDELVMSGSEDGLVYLWDRESTSPAPVQASSSLSNVRAPSVVLEPHRHSSSPAYYPARPARPNEKKPHGSQNGGAAVRPRGRLEGHQEGKAVFAVKWRKGLVLSGGEDGRVGVWGEEETGTEMDGEVA